MRKSCKMTETMANGYSSDRTQQKLSNENQRGRVFKIFCIHVPLMKVASALEGLKSQVWPMTESCQIVRTRLSDTSIQVE